MANFADRLLRAAVALRIASQNARGDSRSLDQTAETHAAWIKADEEFVAAVDAYIAHRERRKA